ncbi:MAG: hypothetical protein II722_08285, partial [Ruminococcus sp.]|nr:hypothetical protein [Ruminococcus sp.]
MLKTNEKAERFFIYAYLGVDIKTCTTEEAIGACVRRAYLDMCRTLRTKDTWKKIKNDKTTEMIGILKSES